jgi:hypothetical protein
MIIEASLKEDYSQFHIEVFTLPGLIHMESMWNPWNPSGIPCGIHGINVG